MVLRIYEIVYLNVINITKIEKKKDMNVCISVKLFVDYIIFCRYLKNVIHMKTFFFTKSFLC